jgi:hypothetical protein
MSSVSARAQEASGVRMMPEGERPLSEQFRIVAKQWVDAHAAANFLEETKSAVLSRLMMNLGREVSVARAEMEVKAGSDWKEHIEKMVEARKQADLLRVQMKWIEMRFSEWQSADANQRKERTYVRQAT